MADDILTRLCADATDNIVDDGCIHRVATDTVLAFAEQHREPSEFFVDVHLDTIDIQLARHACSLMRRQYLSGHALDDAWRFKTGSTINRWRRLPAGQQYGGACPRVILIASTRRIPVTPGAWIDISSNHYGGKRVFYATVTACDTDADRCAWAILGVPQSDFCPSPASALIAHLSPDVSALMHNVILPVATLLVTDAHPHVERYETICGFLEFTRRRLDDDDDE